MPPRCQVNGRLLVMIWLKVLQQEFTVDVEPAGVKHLGAQMICAGGRDIDLPLPLDSIGSGQGYQMEVEITIEDSGKGIENIEEARQPLFTTKPELERSGMGFTIMENFMDQIEVTSSLGKGTTITLRKMLKSNNMIS